MRKHEYEAYDHLFPGLGDSLRFQTPCRLCMEQQGHRFVAHDIVWGNGNRDAWLMVIGKDSAGASRQERLWKGSTVTQIPLTNKNTGAKLRIMLHKAGVDPSTVYMTNSVKCNPEYRLDLFYGQLVASCVSL